MKRVFTRDLGLMDYKQAWDYQEDLFGKIIANKKEADPSMPDGYFLFCEHPHVYTLGKSGSEDHLLVKGAALEEKKATFYKINRGGDITYHGPGQVVGYPILDLDRFFTDIHKYLRFLEEMIILTLGEYGLKAGRIPGLTGVWIDHENPMLARKICAMGVRTSRWVTMHGFAFNVNTDLSYFGNIVPCGITDKAVTSLNKELGRDVDLSEIKEKIKQHFCELFETDLVEEHVTAV
jgi:lipoyl(octanoyl) transferase